MSHSMDSVGETVARLGMSLLEHLDELEVEMAERIRDQVPIYRDDIVTLDQLRATCRESADFILRTIGRIEGPMSSPPSRENGRRRARAGMPLTEVMAAYRVAAHYLWQRLADAAAQTRVGTEAAIRAAEEMWLVLDVFTHEMSDGYRDEVSAKSIADAHRRAALSRAIIDGSLSDANLWEAAELLRFPTSGDYSVVAVTQDAPLPPELEHKLAALSIPSIWVLEFETVVGVLRWPDRARLTRALALIEKAGQGAVGVGHAVDDLRLVPDAARSARLALRAARNRGGVASFETTPLPVIAAGAEAILTPLAARTLDRFREMPEREQHLLLDTFAAWRDAGGVADAAGTTLACHPNTVRHRLRKLEAITGRRLTHPGDLAVLCLVVEYELNQRA